jgi:hypothetical protein
MYSRTPYHFPKCYNAMTARGRNPITPPPLPSHPAISARHTGHLKPERLSTCISKLKKMTNLATLPSSRPIEAALCIPDLTAVKRHEPQQICPHRVSVALVGGKKQIGHVYSERGSGSGAGGGAGTGTGSGSGGGGAVVKGEPAPVPYDVASFMSTFLACKILARLGLLTMGLW